MTMLWGYILLCIQISVIIAKVPDGFILAVEPDCGDASPGSYATITVKSDLYVKIHVDCGSGDSVYIIDKNTVKADILVYYGVDTSSTGNCYFKNPDPDSGLTTVKLVMYYGTHESNVGSNNEEYTVSCLSKGTQRIDSGLSSESKGYNPRNIVRNEGGTLSGSVDFHIVTILDQQIDGQTIPLGRRIQLKANVSGSNIQVTDCLAIGKDDSSINYQVLNAGCGDGIIIPETLGFTANSGVIRSPYFKIFQLDQDSGLRFSCNFTGCVSNCDGSSCTDAARRKRSLQKENSLFDDLFIDPSDGVTEDKDDDDVLTLTSKYYTFTNNDKQTKKKPENTTPSEYTPTVQLMLVIVSGFMIILLLSISTLIYVCRQYYNLRTKFTIRLHQ